MEIYQKLQTSIEKNEGVSMVTVTQVNVETSQEVELPQHTKLIGSKMLVWSDGRTYSQIKLPLEFTELLSEKVVELYKKRKSKLLFLTIDGIEIESYVEVFPPPLHLVVAGAGHVAKPIVEMGKVLGFKITVIDDRSQYANREHFPWADEVICRSFLDYFKELNTDDDTYILLVTRGHKYDVMILPELFNRCVAYIGMIGSRRRISGVFSQLKREFPNETFSNIYAPIGLDIGAQTPEEIAISILAEILKVKNERTGKSLKEEVPFFLAQEKGEDYND